MEQQIFADDSLRNTYSVRSVTEINGSTFPWSGTEYVYVQENGVTRNDFTWTTADAGESAYMWTNQNLMDAEKDSESIENYYLYMNSCWAATASNMFVRAGWSDGIFSSEDDVLKYFCDNFTLENNDGWRGISAGISEYACDWLIYGYDASTWRFTIFSKLSAPEKTYTGGFYAPSLKDSSEQYISDIESSSGHYSSLMSAMEKLQNGYAVGLNLNWFLMNGNEKDWNGGHATTLYGFTYDESKKALLNILPESS